MFEEIKIPVVVKISKKNRNFDSKNGCETIYEIGIKFI